MDWLTGTAHWPFKDFSTPLRPENPVPYVNQKGVVERDLTPKEAYYVFQSYWTDEQRIDLANTGINVSRIVPSCYRCEILNRHLY